MRSLRVKRHELIPYYNSLNKSKIITHPKLYWRSSPKQYSSLPTIG